jgi:leucyl aminopeptidase (aminopeptidase T)
MPPRRRSPPEDALARVVLDRYLSLRRGESVTVETWSHGLPWARAFVVEAWRRGARPTLIVEDEPAFFRTLETVGSRLLSESHRADVRRGDARVYFGGPEAFQRLSGLPPDDLAAVLARHDAVGGHDDRRPSTRSVRLAIGDATPGAAAHYEVNLAAWQAELLRASLVDPGRLAAAGARLVRGLGRGHRLRIRHPNGTDLTLARASRPPFVESGSPGSHPPGGWSRVPSGLLVLPLRGGIAEGTWESNRPTYDRFARPPAAVGGRFDFHAGRLTEFTFDRGGRPFEAAYTRAGRGRNRPVALTVGLNPTVSRAPELLEFAAGTLGLLLGESPYGVGRRGSAFSYLTLLAGAIVEVEGRPWALKDRARARRR